MTVVSDAADFLPVHEVIELPVPGPRGPLSVKVRAVDALVVMEAMQTLPGYGAALPEMTPEDQVSAAKAMAPAVKRICSAGLVEPVLVFDGSGEPAWESVALANRYEIFGAIMRLSGFGEVPGPAASFPAGAAREGGDGRADGGAGAGDGGAGPDAASEIRADA